MFSGRGQITIEFIFTVGLIIFIFILLILVTMNKSIELGRTTRDLNQLNECQQISNAVTYSFLTGSEYTVKLKYPVLINPASRTVTVNEQTTCSIPTAAVIESGSYTEQITFSKIGDYVHAE